MLALLLVSALAADPPPVAPEEARESREQAEPLQSVEPPPSKVPTTTVTEPHVFGDDQKVGPYRQPEWTETRHFPGTRVFVAPPSATFEWWLENKTPFDGGDMRWRSMWEMSFGLGHRLQLDFYLRTEQFGEKPAYLESERVELRYAFADWGKIPGNPTLYLEWIRQETGPMRGEVKLLFGGDLHRPALLGLQPLLRARFSTAPRRARSTASTPASRTHCSSTRCRSAPRCRSSSKTPSGTTVTPTRSRCCSARRSSGTR
ncbi:MAG: hypothetical protein QM723_01120 [Myxococcaceae bacterium]